MSISKALNHVRNRPLSLHVVTKKPSDFNRPKVRWGGKTYESDHPMYESIRKMVLDWYRQ